MANTGNGTIRCEDIRLGALRIHVAYPAVQSGIGVILYPTIMGINDPMRSFAMALADEGLTGVIWDPYDGVEGTGVMPEMLARSRRREDHEVVDDLKRIVDHMRDNLGLASIAGIGWCFGGRIGLLHAGCDSRVMALAAYNPTIWSVEGIELDSQTICRADFPGQTMDEFALAANIRGPVQIAEPQIDVTRRQEYQRLMEVLQTRPDPTFHEYYPGAGHGFSYVPGEANQRAQRYAWRSSLSMIQLAAQADPEGTGVDAR